MTEFSSYGELAEEAGRYIIELETWMVDHGAKSKKPWPEHVVSSKRRRLAWAKKISDLCLRALAKQSEPT